MIESKQEASYKGFMCDLSWRDPASHQAGVPPTTTDHPATHGSGGRPDRRATQDTLHGGEAAHVLRSPPPTDVPALLLFSWGPGGGSWGPVLAGCGGSSGKPGTLPTVSSGTESSTSRNSREMVRQDPLRTRSLCGGATGVGTPLPAATTQPGLSHPRRGPVPVRCHLCWGWGLGLPPPSPPGHLLPAHSTCGTFGSPSPALPSTEPRRARHPAGFAVKSQETHVLFRIFIGNSTEVP